MKQNRPSSSATLSEIDKNENRSETKSAKSEVLKRKLGP